MDRRETLEVACETGRAVRGVWAALLLGLFIAPGCGSGGGAGADVGFGDASDSKDLAGPADGAEGEGGPAEIDAQGDAGGADIVGDGEETAGSDVFEVKEVPATVVLDDGAGHSVEITVEPLAVKGRNGDKTVFSAADAPLRVGFVAEYSEKARYDPQYPPPDIQWAILENPVEYAEAPGGARRITYEPLPGRKMDLLVRIREGAESPTPEFPGGEGIFTFEIVPKVWSNEVLFYVGYDSPDSSENFYGLGENFDHVARRGTFRHMFHTPDSSQESGYNEAHFPIPVLISTLGSGIFVDERRPGAFDVCKKEPERIAITYSTQRLKFHLLFADTPLDVLTRYTDITGRPALPPAWVFGVLQWRNEVSGQAMVMEDAALMREWDIPCSGIWVDRPFATAHESFIFDPAKFPDSKQMVKDLNDLGYRVGIWSVPYLSEGVPDAYAEAEANGYFVESPDVQFEKFGKLMDLTNPGAVALWQKLISNATGIGIEGFKLDYAEDVVTGLSTPSGIGYKTSFSFFNGETEQTMHHWYHYFYHKTYQDMLEGDGFILSRAGGHGDQVVTTVCWPGDLDSDYHFHGEDGHVGGLPASIAGGLSLSVSGYPFYGSDTGGYRHTRPTKEVLLRWVEQTALSTVLQFGGGGVNHNPWDFTKYEELDEGTTVVSQYDEETVEIFREFARLHVRLFPYLYTYAVRAHETGVPVQRPLGMAYPEAGMHPDFHYLFGDWLWVASSSRGEEKVTTEIPPGTWIHWFDRTVHVGPGTEEIDAPLGSLALLVREGAIVPLLRETVDTLASAVDPEVDSYANDAGELVVRIFPASDPSAFATALGPEFQLTPANDGYDLAFSGLVPAFDGAMLVFDLKNAAIDLGEPEALLDGEPVKLVADAAAVAQCAPCALADEGEKLLYVHVTQEEGTVAVR